MSAEEFERSTPETVTQEKPEPRPSRSAPPLDVDRAEKEPASPTPRPGETVRPDIEQRPGDSAEVAPRRGAPELARSAPPLDVDRAEKEPASPTPKPGETVRPDIEQPPGDSAEVAPRRGAPELAGSDRPPPAERPPSDDPRADRQRLELSQPELDKLANERFEQAGRAGDPDEQRHQRDVARHLPEQDRKVGEISVDPHGLHDRAAAASPDWAPLHRNTSDDLVKQGLPQADILGGEHGSEVRLHPDSKSVQHEPGVKPTTDPLVAVARDGQGKELDRSPVLRSSDEHGGRPDVRRQPLPDWAFDKVAGGTVTGAGKVAGMHGLPSQVGSMPVSKALDLAKPALEKPDQPRVARLGVTPEELKGGRVDIMRSAYPADVAADVNAAKLDALAARGDLSPEEHAPLRQQLMALPFDGRGAAASPQQLQDAQLLCSADGLPQWLEPRLARMRGTR